MEQALVFMLGAVMILAGVTWFVVRGVVRTIFGNRERVVFVEPRGSRTPRFHGDKLRGNAVLRPFAILGGLMLLYIVGRSIGL